jgi:hypothetical protein
VSVLTAKTLEAGKSMNLHYAFRAVSVDVISEYAFAQCYDPLGRLDLGQSFFEMIQGLGPTMWIFQQWPGLQKFAMSIPPAIASAMSPPIGHVQSLVAVFAPSLLVHDTKTLSWYQHCRKQCAAVKEAIDSGKASDERPSIFQALLSLNEKDPDYIVPTVDDLKDEACSMLAAAADTTGNAMTVSVYKVVTNPEIYAKVRQELEAAFPDPNATLDFVKLEPLLYLVSVIHLVEIGQIVNVKQSAVIKEGLRLSFGVPGRLPRVVPEGGQVFDGVFIPAGVSQYTLSVNTRINVSIEHCINELLGPTPRSRILP